MQTPNTKAGELTEIIMSKLRSVIKPKDVHTYNKVYSAILDTLETHLPHPGESIEERKIFAGENAVIEGLKRKGLI